LLLAAAATPLPACSWRMAVAMGARRGAAAERERKTPVLLSRPAACIACKQHTGGQVRPSCHCVSFCTRCWADGSASGKRSAPTCGRTDAAACAEACRARRCV
jgi:hypothetical protein